MKNILCDLTYTDILGDTLIEFVQRGVAVLLIDPNYLHKNYYGSKLQLQNVFC